MIGEYFSKVNAALIITPVINSFSIKREIKKNDSFYKYLNITPIELIKSRNWQNIIDEARINKLLEY